MDQSNIQPTNGFHSTNGFKEVSVWPGRYEQSVPLVGVNPPSSKKDGDTPKSVKLSDVLATIKRHRAVLSLFLVIGLLLGFLVTLPQTPVYRAHTTLEILSLNENFLNTKDTNPLVNGDNNYEISDLQTQIKILQGQTLSRRVVAALASRLPETIAGPSNQGSLLSLLGPGKNIPVKDSLTDAARTLAVHTSGRTRVIDVSIESPSPRIAAEYANSLAAEFIQENMEARWRATKKTSDWLSRELDDTRVKLEHSENALQEYARNSGLIFTDEKTNISEDKLRQLQQQLSAVTFDRMTKQSRYQLAQSNNPDTLPDVVNDTGLRQTQEKITDLERELASLNQMYTPEYRKVRLVEAQIASLKIAFQRDKAAILDRVKNEYEEALNKERMLTASYAAQTKQVGGDNEKSVQYNILKREVDSNRQLYETMMLQLKSASIASAMRASNVRVLDEADIPEKPYSPNLQLNCALGLFTGLLAGGFFVASRDGSNRTLQDPGDAQLWANLPELGFVPNADINLDGNMRLRLSEAYSRMLQRGGSAPHMPNGENETSLTVRGKGNASLVADATRAVLTSILLSNDNGISPRVLVITSPGTSEGKTTLACNLGIAMAEIRQRVLVIDADMRRPRIHTLFDVPNGRGLSTLLSEESLPAGESVDNMIQRTGIPGLDVLTSGPTGYKATNLLYSKYLGELLQSLKERYDMVLIDTPPMLRMSDARILGRMSDAVILVARARKTSREAAMAAHRRLTEDGVRVLGTVLNDWDPRASNRSYYQDYLTPYYTNSSAD